ncbi:MAG TPA: polynucleotide adenylyltransferase PcnB, partial [Thermoanaerobaculia bacterium]|nr:polynucleotide adenylyltransferase PcnB [Thermoanaerobaculia bacterium]
MEYRRFPIVRPRSAHPISRDAIDPDALKVLYRLKSTGYRAYLVGGSVRDLLMGRTPKDFDIGTDARPEEVRAIFRNCRLIGRRFRLAHILFRGGKVIEVATFRGRPEAADAGDGIDLLVTSDNTWGTPEEDAVRRDFTINGLFYDIADFSVIDWVGGLDDLEAGLVRAIGDPDVRFREDPVRMLRAVEFATRLSFAITPRDYEAILSHRKDLARSATPRVTEELAAMLRGGQALPTFLLLREMGLLDVLLPELSDELRRIDPEHAGGAGHFFWTILEVLDAERRRGRVFDEAVYFAVLALPLLRAELARVRPGGRAEPSLLVAKTNAVVDPLALALSTPNALVHRVKSILVAQGRVADSPEMKASTRRFLAHPDFPAAIDLADLRAMASGRGGELVREWRRLAERG